MMLITGIKTLLMLGFKWMVPWAFSWQNTASSAGLFSAKQT